jgi:ribosomal protein S12 methylthiotransferase accessory factor
MRKELERARRAMGVTRIARVTGLDRAGVEVACAVRPAGHVLQICNGKGATAALAAASALGEAAELWGAERVDPALLVHARASELGAAALQHGVATRGSAGEVIAPRLWEARIAWRPARDLHTSAEVLVPAQAVHCPPAGTALGPSPIRWSSSGMGAHPDPGLALLHALLEAAERDGLSRALPRGWTRSAVRARGIDLSALAKTAPRAAALVERLSRSGLRASLFDLRPVRGWLGLPLAGALLVDPEEGPVPLTAGYACALSADEALTAALLEAAQSRLTDVHGAREDVAPPDRAAAAELARACARSPALVDAAALERPATGAKPAGALGRTAGGNRAEDGVRLVLSRLRAAGFSSAAAAELAPKGFPLSIVKVLVPGLRVSELL